MPDKITKQRLRRAARRAGFRLAYVKTDVSAVFILLAGASVAATATNAVQAEALIQRLAA
jgi:hypothetical protein